jgi:DNA-binding FadR family transcriptional regulator
VSNLNPQVPKWEALANVYREKILSGELEPGIHLEPARYIAQVYEMTRINIDRAWAILATEGLLELKENAPPVVADPLSRKGVVGNDDVNEVPQFWLYAKRIALVCQRCDTTLLRSPEDVDFAELNRVTEEHVCETEREREA